MTAGPGLLSVAVMSTMISERRQDGNSSGTDTGTVEECRYWLASLALSAYLS